MVPCYKSYTSLRVMAKLMLSNLIIKSNPINNFVMQGQKKENKTNSSSTNIEKVEKVEPIYLWAEYPDADGNLQWSMIPYYYDFFKQFSASLIMLNETINTKWKPQQLTAYQTYLFDVHSYIVDYIWTGKVAEFNAFNAAMQQYDKLTNPLGKELYDIQIDYIQKVEKGYDFKLNKKKKKGDRQVLKKKSEEKIYDPDDLKIQESEQFLQIEGWWKLQELEGNFKKRDRQLFEPKSIKPKKKKQGWHEKTHERKVSHRNQNF